MRVYINNFFQLYYTHGLFHYVGKIRKRKSTKLKENLTTSVSSKIYIHIWKNLNHLSSFAAWWCLDVKRKIKEKKNCSPPSIFLSKSRFLAKLFNVFFVVVIVKETRVFPRSTYLLKIFSKWNLETFSLVLPSIFLLVFSTSFLSKCVFLHNSHALVARHLWVHTHSFHASSSTFNPFVWCDRMLMRREIERKRGAATALVTDKQKKRKRKTERNLVFIINSWQKRISSFSVDPHI